MTLVINLFGGPGTGKSTTAAATFAELKHNGVNVELVTEYAKDKVWERSTKVFGCQPYMLGKQYYRLWRLQDEVDVVVTDSPILLMLEFGRKWGQGFRNYVIELHNTFNNLNYFLVRQKMYNPKGRMQTEEEARELDVLFKQHLDGLAVPYDILESIRGAEQRITQDVLERLNDRPGTGNTLRVSTL